MFNFLKDKQWEKSIKNFAEEKITLEEFLEINKNKVLYYSTPFLQTNDGKMIPNALAMNHSDAHYFPTFSDMASIKKHFKFFGVQGVIIKGNLKDALASLDSDNILKNWGLVVDPHIKNFVAFPPLTRIK